MAGALVNYTCVFEDKRIDMHEDFSIYDREMMQCSGAGDPDSPLLVGGGGS